MPEGIPYSSSNVVAGTGLDLNYVGNHCYAYSGVLEPGAGPTTVLSFTTGNSYIVGIFEMNSDFKGGGGNDYSVTLKLNGITIVYEQDIANNWLAGDNQYPVIIPPYTKVEGLLSDGGANKDMNLNFTGKLYK